MSRRKSATILTVKSFSALSKLCSSPKSFNSFKTLSTAAERSHLYNPNGFDGEIAADYPQNPTGSYGNNINSVELNHNTSRNGQGRAFAGNYREFQQNPNGFNGGNPNGENNRGNSSSYTERRINEYQQGPFVQNGNANGYYREHSQEVQRNPSGPNMNTSANAYYAESTQQFQQNSNQHYVGNNGLSMQNKPFTYNMGSNGAYQQVPGNNYDTQMYQQSPSGYHGGNISNRNGYYANGSQNGLMGPQIYDNSTEGGESNEGAESDELKGTIEELDGFCEEGKLKDAIEVMGLMEKQSIPIDMPRYVMLMKACGESKAIEEAKYVHEHLVRSVSTLQVSTYNEILKMYCKCGLMEDAYKLFDKMPQRNMTTWDTMITGLAKNGFGEEAIELFTDFKRLGFVPDGQMFFGVFSACGVVGDISEGLLHFESMKKNYNIVPSMNHYVSVVDMLGSTGYLDEALEFIEMMPLEPNVDIWETLMNLSRVHGNTELGDRCAEFVELLDPTRLNDQSRSGLIPVKPTDVAKEKEKKKLAGQSLLEVRSRVHEYRAGDRSHPDNDKIYALLRGMKQQMKEAGYIPEVKFVLHDIDQESKEEALLAHSERLAVAQGLMTSPARSTMRVIKNLRVCGDCHNALKIISKIVGRELVMRDAKRFHHFKDGLCSCNDYW